MSSISLWCTQWQLVTVIRGGAATPPNKDFIKTKKKSIRFSTAAWTIMTYDISLPMIQL